MTSLNMLHNRTAALVVCLIVISLMSTGCAGTIVPAHPNQINTFDGAAYDTLIVVQASMQQVKTMEAKFPQYKEQVNQAIAAYNTAISAYKLYHSTATPSTVQEQALTLQLSDLSSQVGKLLTAFGVKL